MLFLPNMRLSTLEIVDDLTVCVDCPLLAQSVSKHVVAGY